MTSDDQHLSAPIDAASAERLDALGLRYCLVDHHDAAAVDAWRRAVARGFHDVAPEADADKRRRRRARLRARRLTGVWREGAEEPVASASSWIAPMTMPGRHDSPLDVWSISSVTVAPMHVGRGIARALLEGELRTAAGLGLAAAALTVSESTLYGRYGFGIATQVGELQIETARVRWSGPEPELELEFVGLELATALLEELHAQAVAATPGDLRVQDGFWRQAVGADEPDDAETRKRRFVRAVDGERAVGLAVYRLDAPKGDDFTKHTLVVEAMAAPSAAAAAALWRFLLGQPLVETVRAELVAVDDPVRWWCGDWRAVRQSTRDHNWLRLLDVPRSLEARGYDADGTLALRVEDELGFAAGDVVLRAREGSASVERAAAAPEGAPVVELDAAALASLWLGGFTASELAAAGRIRAEGDALALADRLFRTPRAPFLSTWY